MTFPTPPQQVASFFDTRAPTPGEVGAQFAEVQRSISEILSFLKTFVRTDGKLRNESIGKEQISAEMAAEITEKAISTVQ